MLTHQLSLFGVYTSNMRVTRGEKMLLERRRMFRTQLEQARILDMVKVSYIRYENDHHHNPPPDREMQVEPYERCLLTRRRLGERQIEVAREMECSPNHLGNMERGQADPARLVEYWSARGEL